ncbi:MerR family transcriptional regulator [Calidifontibacter terrae]
MTTPDLTWTIAELAVEFDVTHRSLRHYEELGMLTPQRDGNKRVYDRGDHIRLGLIMRGKRLGFSLPQIHTIVTMYDQQPGESGQLRYLLGQLADRRADLEQRRLDIEDSLHELETLERRCREDLRGLQSSASAAADTMAP